MAISKLCAFSNDKVTVPPNSVTFVIVCPSCIQSPFDTDARQLGVMSGWSNYHRNILHGVLVVFWAFPLSFYATTNAYVDCENT